MLHQGAMEVYAEDLLLEHLEKERGCHTVILYGSRAQGTARPDSDWDVMCLNDGAQESYLHTYIEGVGEVNAYIYPESMAPFDALMTSRLYMPIDAFVTRISKGMVLMEKDALGTDIVERAIAFSNSFPKMPDPDRIANIRQYFFDGRLEPFLNPANPLKAGLPEVVRDYMRHEALLNSVFYYFRLRRKWEPSPTDWHTYFEQHDAHMLELLTNAEKDTAAHADFERLFTYVMSVV